MNSVKFKKVGINNVAVKPELVSMALNIDYSREDWYDNSSVSLYQVTNLHENNINVNKKTYLGELSVNSHMVMSSGNIVGTELPIAQIDVIANQTQDIKKRMFYITESTYQQLSEI